MKIILIASIIALSFSQLISTNLYAGDREEDIAIACSASSGGEPLAWAGCVGKQLATQEVQNLFVGKAFGCGHEIRKLLDKSCRNGKPSKPPFVFSMPYKNGYIVGYKSRGHSLYYSMDGKNLRGGGNTYLVYAAGQKVRAIVPYRDGVITAFSQAGIYFSPNGFDLGGGGATTRVYTGSQKVRTMNVVNGRVRTCFRSACYCSPNGKFLGGGGYTKRC